jgi:GTPase SAR1 family protein
MERIIGVIDKPVQPGKTDNLDIDIHSKALTEYVAETTTSITIGIQGEWGSGKTSLINSIYHHFDSEDTLKQIWINSWQFSLLMLQKIIGIRDLK